MKFVKLLLAVLLLAFVAMPAVAQDGTTGGGDGDIQIIEDPKPLSCYGFVGSINNGDSGSVSFCSTGHACNTEWQPATTSLCQDNFAAKCAARPCPEGQECEPIRLSGNGITLTNCTKLPAPEGTCRSNEICACDYTLTARLDCGCQCR